MMAQHRRRAGSLLVAAAAALAACGIPPTDDVEILDASEYQDLLEGTTSTVQVVADPEEEDPFGVRLFWIGPDNRLESVVRDLPQDPPLINEVLAVLELGPQPVDQEAFGDLGPLQTLLPPDLMPRVISQPDATKHVIQVNPEAELRSLSANDPERFRLIVTQIVCTVMPISKDPITGIEFVDAEPEPISLTDFAGQTITGPANEGDFDDCRTGADERAEAEERQEQADEEGAADATAGSSSG